MKEKKYRNIIFDELKGIGILLVIIGHAIQFTNGERYLINEQYFNNIIFQFIYSFHMPLFMLISGYFFYNTCNNYEYRNIINKKIKLFLPIITYSILLFIFTRQWLYNFNISTYLFSLPNNLWFLWAIILASFIQGTIRFKLKAVYIYFS